MKKRVMFVICLIVSMSFVSGFTHPGLLNNQAEYDLMKAKVAAQEEPWYSGYQMISENIYVTVS